MGKKKKKKDSGYDGEWPMQYVYQSRLCSHLPRKQHPSRPLSPLPQLLHPITNPLLLRLLTPPQMHPHARPRKRLVPRALLLPLLRPLQAPQTRNPPLNLLPTTPHQRREAHRNHEALRFQPVSCLVTRRIVIHAVHIAHGVHFDGTPERDPCRQQGFFVDFSLGRAPVLDPACLFRGPVRHQLDALLAYTSNVWSPSLFGPVRAGDVQDRRHTCHLFFLNMIQLFGRFFGYGHQILGADETVPAAAPALEQVQIGSEAGAACEAGFCSQGALRVLGGEIARGAGT